MQYIHPKSKYIIKSGPDRVLIERMVKRCMRHLALKKYELGITATDKECIIKLLTVVDKPKRRSMACAVGIEINLSGWQYLEHPTYRQEYKSFDDDPVIGRIDIGSKEHDLWLTVAHEVCHFIQSRRGRLIRRYQSSWRKPHGHCFQDIYRMLRRDLINPMIMNDLKNSC